MKETSCISSNSFKINQKREKEKNITNNKNSSNLDRNSISISKDTEIKVESVNNCFRISLFNENSEEANSKTSGGEKENSDIKHKKENLKFLQLKENLSENVKYKQATESKSIDEEIIKLNGNSNYIKSSNTKEHSYLNQKRVKPKTSTINQQKNSQEGVNNVKEIKLPSFGYSNITNHVEKLKPYSNQQYSIDNKKENFNGVDDKSTTANTQSNYAISHNFGNSTTLSNIDKSDINFFVDNITYNDIFNNLGLMNLLKSDDLKSECLSLSSLKEKDLYMYGNNSNIFDFPMIGEEKTQNGFVENDVGKFMTLSSIKVTEKSETAKNDDAKVKSKKDN